MTLVPRILARGTCRRFVFMGGNIAETPNFKGYELNHAPDYCVLKFTASEAEYYCDFKIETFEL